MIASKLKIFVIDDDTIISEIIEKRLRQVGFEDIKIFDSAESGFSALDHRPDFVILDFSLPGMNGFDTLKNIKNRRSGTEVVVHTSLLDDKLSEKCLNNGASAFLTKGEDDSIDKIITHAKKMERKKKRVSRVIQILALIILIAIIYLLWVYLS